MDLTTLIRSPWSFYRILSNSEKNYLGGETFWKKTKNKFLRRGLFFWKKWKNLWKNFEIFFTVPKLPINLLKIRLNHFLGTMSGYLHAKNRKKSKERIPRNAKSKKYPFKWLLWTKKKSKKKSSSAITSTISQLVYMPNFRTIEQTIREINGNICAHRNTETQSETHTET